MIDQQNLEAVSPLRPILLSLWQRRSGNGRRLARPGGRHANVADRMAARTAPKTGPSVESLAKGLGLKLGDQNELTIRRIKRGKSYSFVRANGSHVRNPHHPPPAFDGGAPGLCRGPLFADPNSHLQAVGRDAAGRLQYRYHSDWEKVREHRKAHRLARLVAALPRSAATSRRTSPATCRPVNSRSRR